MRPIRRSDMAPRVEMTPMIDVVFLLLTFFIYSVAMMVRAEVLPVRLTTLAAGEGKPARGAVVNAITIDSKGELFFNRVKVSPEELDARLKEFAAKPDRPPLYLAMEAQGDTDRGPLFIGLIESVRGAGVENFVIVGQPKKSGPEGPGVGAKGGRVGGSRP